MAFTLNVSKSIAARFGRKAGFLRHCLYVTKLRLGLLPYHEDLDWGAVRRLVFVCNGNICRSAYGEAKSKSLGMPAISFGLAASDGSPADDKAVRAAQARGVDLSVHRARSINAVGIRTGDLVLAMEPQQLKLIERGGGAQGAQVSLLGLWCKPRRPHIEDPYGLISEYFFTCFGLIDDALGRICLRIRQAGQR